VKEVEEEGGGGKGKREGKKAGRKKKKKRKKEKEKTKSAVTIWISRISSAVSRILASTPDKLPLTPPSSYRHGYYGEDLSTLCTAEKHQVSLWRHGVLYENYCDRVESDKYLD